MGFGQRGAHTPPVLDRARLAEPRWARTTTHARPSITRRSSFNVGATPDGRTTGEVLRKTTSDSKRTSTTVFQRGRRASSSGRPGSVRFGAGQPALAPFPLGSNSVISGHREVTNDRGARQPGFEKGVRRASLGSRGRQRCRRFRRPSFWDVGAGPGALGPGRGGDPHRRTNRESLGIRRGRANRGRRAVNMGRQRLAAGGGAGGRQFDPAAVTALREHGRSTWKDSIHYGVWDTVIAQRARARVLGFGARDVRPPCSRSQTSSI